MVFFGDSELFYGSQRVRLQQVDGILHGYKHCNYEQRPNAPESLQNVLKRKDPIPIQDNDHLPVVVPCVPCVDPMLLSCIDKIHGEHNENLSHWPQELVRVGPLVKRLPTADQNNDNLTEFFALASGIRSACMRIDGYGWVRLKGCGNHGDGFVVASHTHVPHRVPYCEIRGCAFPHTAKCELFMSSKLESILGPQGIPAANPEALGWFEYTADPERPLGSQFPTACIVERTRGDRRLGTHLLAGLALLLDQLIDAKYLDVEALLGAFPVARPRVEPQHTKGNDEPMGIVTTAMLMSDYCSAKMYNMGDDINGLTFSCPRDSSVFANVLHFPFPQLCPDRDKLPQQYVRRAPEAGSDAVPTACIEGRRAIASQEWSLLWQNACDRVSSVNKQSSKSASTVLAYLYSRIGYECGTFLHYLHRKCRVSWGTYSDSLCFQGQLHCNAHANNFVILAETESKKCGDRFLGYLDLDMAFDDTTFVDIDAKKVGIKKSDHDILLFKEHCSFMEVLVGADSTSGVPAVAQDALNRLPESIRLAHVALTDTMLMGYLHAYSGGDENYPVAVFDPDLHSVAYGIVRMALIVMADYLA
mmetsp:Transcript_11981/g.17965  ORF Transcript_11981/g.17965 Transcript_11981/m.17965 type:complete len:588 (-) Transcript_11981:214-1977(-)